MRIAIDINGVLRDTLNKIEQVYQKNFIDNHNLFDNPTYLLDESGNTENYLVEDLFEYKMNLPVTSLELTNHFKFQNEEEYYSFLYEDYTMEIFGHAGSSEISTFNYLNDTYNEFRDQYDFIIISNEINKSKPASLFFLSKFGCLVDTVKFYNNLTKNLILDEFDILLTANPELLLNCPQDKVVIKYETTYNKDINIKNKITSMKNLSEVLKNLNHD